MSNPFATLFPFPSGAPADGSALATGPQTLYPLKWTLAEMYKIEWTWKKLVATLTAGSVVANDGTGPQEGSIAGLSGNNTPIDPTNWLGLVPGPGFAAPRSWTASANTTFVVDVHGILIPAFISLSAAFSGLYELPAGTKRFVKALDVTLGVTLSVGSNTATLSATSSISGPIEGNWSAFGETLPFTVTSSDGGTGVTLSFGTLPAITVTAPAPFIASPGPIG